MSDIVSRRQRTPWFWPDFVYYSFGEGREHDKTLKILHSFTYNVSNGVSGYCNTELLRQSNRRQHTAFTFMSPQVIRERAENVAYTESDNDSDRGTRKRRAFLDMLLNTTDEDGNKMSHEDIQEEVDTFMFRVSG